MPHDQLLRVPLLLPPEEEPLREPELLPELLPEVDLLLLFDLLVDFDPLLLPLLPLLLRFSMFLQFFVPLSNAPIACRSAFRSQLLLQVGASMWRSAYRVALQ